MTTPRNQKHLLRRVLVPAAILLTTAACNVGAVDGGVNPGSADAAGPPAECSSITETPAVVMGGGTDQTGFVTIVEGADMAVTIGPQGLYMVTPSLRTTGLYPGTGGSRGQPHDPMVVVDIYLGELQIGGSAQERVGMNTTATGAELLGIFSPFSGNRDQYDGMLVTLRATVEDACGRTGTAELSVIARP